MVLGLVVMSKQERNRNASTLLGILVDEIARQEKYPMKLNHRLIFTLLFTIEKLDFLEK